MVDASLAKTYFIFSKRGFLSRQPAMSRAPLTIRPSQDYTASRLEWLQLGQRKSTWRDSLYLCRSRFHRFSHGTCRSTATNMSRMILHVSGNWSWDCVFVLFNITSITLDHTKFDAVGLKTYHDMKPCQQSIITNTSFPWVEMASNMQSVPKCPSQPFFKKYTKSATTMVDLYASETDSTESEKTQLLAPKRIPNLTVGTNMVSTQLANLGISLGLDFSYETNPNYHRRHFLLRSTRLKNAAVRLKPPGGSEMLRRGRASPATSNGLSKLFCSSIVTGGIWPLVLGFDHKAYNYIYTLIFWCCNQPFAGSWWLQSRAQIEWNQNTSNSTNQRMNEWPRCPSHADETGETLVFSSETLQRD